ncbi:DUF6273 domain-containing protein [Fibrella sp. WM1]|uniref:DUF6273 domain-containing protein n=1 Tax=Fibrella musci TaxID=3242485 RepID=UPI00352186BB
MTQDSIIAFGNRNWQILDVKGDKALIISGEIIELRWYHQKFVEITWANSAIRQYLNNEFYSTFSQDEKAKISTVTSRNLDNQWFRTNGGKDTTDSIFLLSLEEICEYFGNSGAKLRNKGNQIWSIDDENNSRRQAKYGGNFHWWRLRSPGYYARTAASVSYNGCVYVRGNGVYGSPRDGGGIRPALWLILEE